MAQGQEAYLGSQRASRHNPLEMHPACLRGMGSTVPPTLSKILDTVVACKKIALLIFEDMLQDALMNDTLCPRLRANSAALSAARPAGRQRRGAVAAFGDVTDCVLGEQCPKR
jgi:hypothetical protein